MIEYLVSHVLKKKVREKIDISSLIINVQRFFLLYHDRPGGIYKGVLQNQQAMESP